MRRLAVFHLEHHPIQSHVYASSTAVWQLTNLANIIPECEHPDKVAIIERLPTGVRPLWLAAVIGSCSDALMGELTAAGLKKLPVEFTDQRLREVIRLGVKGYHDVENARILRMIEGEETASIEDISPYFPFQLSMIQLGLYRPIEATHLDQQNVVIVGESLDDFAYYFCLSRLRPNVCWLPPSWVKKHGAHFEGTPGTKDKLTPEESIILHFSLALRDSVGRGIVKCTFASLSLSTDEVAEVVKDLAKAGVVDPEGFQSQSEVGNSADTLPTHPQIAFERDNISRPSALQFVENELPGWFETPKPRQFRKIDPFQFRWITEISIKGHAVPRHPALGPHVMRDSRLGSLGVRAGRNGVAYYCPNMMVLRGLDVDQLLVKPSIRLPEALDIFQSVARASNYRCTPSQKGVFAQEATRTFGGLSALAEFLRNSSRSTLLDKFLDLNRPDEGVHDEGVQLASDRRRYLDLASIRKIIGTSEDALSLIDELVVKGVFHRGFIFKCRLCRNADWFSVDEISSQFKCKRCGLDQTYARAHSLRDGEPSWFYKLDELVFQAHQNGFAVPILALEYLRKQTKESFLFTAELDVFPENETKPFIEMDICCIPDGILTIGEAKKSNSLDKTPAEVTRTLGKYRLAAEKFGVGQVVFATAENNWSEETTKRIEQAFSNLPVAIMLLGREHLFS